MGQHVLPSAFQTNKATRSPCEKGPVSHPHSGNKAFPLQRCKWPSLPYPGKQKSGLTWPLWTSAHVQRSKGGGELRCSQSKEWSRLDAICHCAKWQVTVHKRAARLTRLQTHCLHWHFLSFSPLPLWVWRWAPSVDLGWGPPLRCSGEAKAEAKE